MMATPPAPKTNLVPAMPVLSVIGLSSFFLFSLDLKDYKPLSLPRRISVLQSSSVKSNSIRLYFFLSMPTAPPLASTF